MASEYSEEIEDIKADLQSYHPGKTVKRPGRVAFPTTLFIGMFGRTGCGKTSLINSMRYAAQGKLRRAYWLHVAGQEMGGGHTMYRKRVEITENIAVVDNRGMDKLHAKEAMKELCAQLAGTRGYSEVVTWETSVKDPSQQLGDRIATAVFVFSAKHNIDENIKGLSNVISVMHNTQGQYPVAVITHVDTATANEVEEVKAALRAEGVSDSCIFTVANLTQENKHLQEKYQANVLNLLDRCMTDGDLAMVFHHHKQFEEEQRRADQVKEEQRRADQVKEEQRRADQEEQRRADQVEQEQRRAYEEEQRRADQVKQEERWAYEKDQRRADQVKEKQRRAYEEDQRRIDRDREDQRRADVEDQRRADVEEQRRADRDRDEQRRADVEEQRRREQDLLNIIQENQKALEKAREKKGPCEIM